MHTHTHAHMYACTHARHTHMHTHHRKHTYAHSHTHTHRWYCTGSTVTWTQTQTYQLHPIICHSVTVALQFSPLTWMQSQTLLHQLHHIVCHSVTSATLYTSHWNAAINLASSVHLEKQCPHALSKCFVLRHVSWHLVSWRHITFKASRSHVSGLSMNPSAHHIFCFLFFCHVIWHVIWRHTTLSKRLDLTCPVLPSPHLISFYAMSFGISKPYSMTI